MEGGPPCNAGYALGLARARSFAATYEIGCNLIANALEERSHPLIEQARWCLRFQRRSRWSASE